MKLLLGGTSTEVTIPVHLFPRVGYPPDPSQHIRKPATYFFDVRMNVCQHESVFQITVLVLLLSISETFLYTTWDISRVHSDFKQENLEKCIFKKKIQLPKFGLEKAINCALDFIILYTPELVAKCKSPAAERSEGRLP